MSENRRLEFRHQSTGKDMNSVYDWTLLGLVLAATLPFAAANGALIAWRKRRYFQAQGGVFLIVSSSLAGLFWIFSSFLSNGHFRKHGIFRNCFLWNSVRGLGISLWFSFTIIRFHRMHLLSKGNSAWQLRKYTFCVLVCLLPIFVLVLVSSQFESYENKKYCILKSTWELAGWFLICAPYLLVSAVLLWTLRKETDPLLVTEFMQSYEYLIMAFVIVLLAGTAILTKGRQSISGRCFLTFCTCCLVFFHFWVRFGHPVYLCVFKPEEEMDRFEKKLSQSGARALQVASSFYSQSSYPPSSEGAVLEAFYKASTEAEKYKSIVMKLREEKEMLQSRLAELELRGSGDNEAADEFEFCRL